MRSSRFLLHSTGGLNLKCQAVGVSTRKLQSVVASILNGFYLLTPTSRCELSEVSQTDASLDSQQLAANGRLGDFFGSCFGYQKNQKSPPAPSSAPPLTLSVTESQTSATPTLRKDGMESPIYEEIQRGESVSNDETRSESGHYMRIDSLTENLTPSTQPPPSGHYMTVDSVIENLTSPTGQLDSPTQKEGPVYAKVQKRPFYAKVQKRPKKQASHESPDCASTSTYAKMLKTPMDGSKLKSIGRMKSTRRSLKVYFSSIPL